MNKLKFILMTVLACWSCQSNDEADPPTSLTGTAWKLAGIVDAQTGTLKVLEPKDCADCYTLTFVTDTQAEGFLEEYAGYREKFVLDFSLLGEYSITDISRPSEAYEFIRLLYNHNTKSYSVTSNELRFINDIDNYYLLFKSLKPL